MEASATAASEVSRMGARSITLAAPARAGAGCVEVAASEPVLPLRHGRTANNAGACSRARHAHAGWCGGTWGMRKPRC